MKAYLMRSLYKRLSKTLSFQIKHKRNVHTYNKCFLSRFSHFSHVFDSTLSWDFHRLVVWCISWFKESKHTHRSSLANITNVVPSLQCISWFKESKHTHRSSLANITNVVPSLQCISWFKECKHTHRSSFANITNVVPSLQCISWFKECKHTHRSSFANITNAVPSL